MIDAICFGSGLPLCTSPFDGLTNPALSLRLHPPASLALLDKISSIPSCWAISLILLFQVSAPGKIGFAPQDLFQSRQSRVAHHSDPMFQFQGPHSLPISADRLWLTAHSLSRKSCPVKTQLFSAREMDRKLHLNLRPKRTDSDSGIPLGEGQGLLSQAASVGVALESPRTQSIRIRPSVSWVFPHGGRARGPFHHQPNAVGQGQIPPARR